MKILNSILILGGTIKICLAVSFKVICSVTEYGGDSMAVVIDGAEYPMTSDDKFYHKYSFDGKPSQYYYVVKSGATEASSELILFGQSQREWVADSSSTLNEVYGRRLTVGDSILKPMPRLYPKRSSYDKFSLLFQEGEIPVIDLTMSESDYTMLTTDTGQYSKNNYTVDFKIYNPYDVYSFTGATIELAGMGSKNNKKKPYEIKLSEIENDAKENTEIFNRSGFKLRSLYFDESYIKNKLTLDITESVGLPVAQSSFARFYVNKVPFGLHELAETYKKKFVRNNFYPDKKKDEVELGSYYKGISGSEYQAYLYPDPEQLNSELYNVQFSPEGKDPYADLKELQNYIQSISSQQSITIEEIEKTFDIEMFLRFAAVEYLACHWDGYLINGNNYFIYRENNDGKFYVFSFDFDITLGRWCKEGINKNFDQYVKEFKDKPYGTTGVKRNPALYAVINLPNIRKRLDELIVEIAKNVFNENALKDRILYFKEFLKDDIIWDKKAMETLPTQNYPKADIQPLISADDSLSYFDGIKEDNGDMSILQYISVRTTDVSNAYGISPSEFTYGNKNGEVGQKIIALGSGSDTGGNSETSDCDNHNYIEKVFYAMVFTLLVIMMGN